MSMMETSNRRTLWLICLCLCTTLSSFALSLSSLRTSGKSLVANANEQCRATTRRTILASAAALLFVTTPPAPANAFDNAIPEYTKYADKPKRRGTPPKDLGLAMRTIEGEDLDEITQLGLRSCDGNPNCFSTTGNVRLEDRTQYGTDFLIAPWKPPASDPTPLQTVAETVRAYEPGQGGVDGGGFATIKEDTSSYLYYQFESLKKGYIDDVEFAWSHDDDKDRNNNVVLVRSASRVGYTDFGVNAIRLNYLASKLRSKGWTMNEITPTTHRDYWNAANDARDATFDPDRRKMAATES